MTDITASVVIDRPRAEVAAYMFDPTHDAEWTTGVVEARPRHPGRLAVGSTVERRVRFMGREFGYEYAVIEADGDRFVVMQVDRPFPMHIRYELQPLGDRTRASIRATGDASGFFRLAGPLLDGMVRRNIQSDLDQLKTILERRPAGSGGEVGAAAG